MGAELTLQPPAPPAVPSPEPVWPTSRCWPAVLHGAPQVPRLGFQSPSENFQGLGPAWVLLLTYLRKLKFIEVHL